MIFSMNFSFPIATLRFISLSHLKSHVFMLPKYSISCICLIFSLSKWILHVGTFLLIYTRGAKLIVAQGPHRAYYDITRAG